MKNQNYPEAVLWVKNALLTSEVTVVTIVTQILTTKVCKRASLNEQRQKSTPAALLSAQGRKVRLQSQPAHHNWTTEDWRVSE